MWRGRPGSTARALNHKRENRHDVGLFRDDARVESAKATPA